MSRAGAPPEGPTAGGGVRAAARRSGAGGSGASVSELAATRDAPDTLVDRPRLRPRRWRPLLLATAPAGYGKTVLLRQLWAQLPDKGVVRAWLSLGPAHRDFEVFLRSLSAALQAQSFAPPEWRGRPEEIGARLANAFAEAGEPFFLMLDDYHAATSPDLDSFVRALAGASGDAVHLAIATRVRAKVGAAVMAARGDLVAIGAADLSFSLEETQRLFEGRLSDEGAAALHAQTEGWPAALQLAELDSTAEPPGKPAAWAARATSGEIGALVAEETFEPLPEALQDLLVETAYLETLGVDEVDEVRGRGDSAGLLAELTGSVALVFTDRDRSDRLRRHVLLRRFLEARFTLLGEARRSELAERSISVLARAGEIGSALRLARRVSPDSAALALLESAPPASFWTAEALLDLPGDLSALSDKRFAQAPRATLLRGLSFYADGRMSDARAAVEAGLTGMRKEDARRAGIRIADAARDLKAWDGLRAAIFDETLAVPALDELATLARDMRPAALAAHAASVLAMRAGRSEEACSMAELAGAKVESGTAARELGAVQECVTALFHASPNRAGAALERLRGAAIAHPNVEAASRLCGAWLAYERGEAWTEEGLPSRDAPPLLLGLSPELLVERARLAAAAIHWTDGIETATAALQAARNVAGASGWRRADAILESEMLTLSARSEMRSPETRALADRVARHGKAGCPEAILALARFDVSSGAYKRARTKLAALLATPLARRRRVEALVIDACAANAMGQLDEANIALGQFLEMSGEGVLARCFHEDGLGLWEPVMALAARMATLDADSASLDVVADLAVTRSVCERGSALVPPTQQESVMFAALRTAGSRAGAADALDMSENTLKYYLKRVFEKWGVRDWRLAMRIAERLAAEAPLAA